MRIHIERSIADKPDQRHPEFFREFDRKARWRADRDDDGYSCHQCFLNEFKAQPAADEKDLVRKRQLAGEKFCTDHFVESVVTSDVFTDHFQFTFDIE